MFKIQEERLIVEPNPNDGIVISNGLSFQWLRKYRLSGLLALGISLAGLHALPCEVSAQEAPQEADDHAQEQSDPAPWQEVVSAAEDIGKELGKEAKDETKKTLVRKVMDKSAKVLLDGKMSRALPGEVLEGMREGLPGTALGIMTDSTPTASDEDDTLSRSLPEGATLYFHGVPSHPLVKGNKLIKVGGYGLEIPADYTGSRSMKIGGIRHPFQVHFGAQRQP